MLGLTGKIYGTETKGCRACLLVKPVTEYGKHKGSNDGLRNRCKSCLSKIEKSRPKVAEQTEKHCRECQLVKPVTEFYYSGNGGYQVRCKPCHVAYTERNRKKRKPGRKCRDCGVRKPQAMFTSKSPTMCDDCFARKALS